MRPKASYAMTSPQRDDFGASARHHCYMLGKYIMEYITGAQYLEVLVQDALGVARAPLQRCLSTQEHSSWLRKKRRGV